MYTGQGSAAKFVNVSVNMFFDRPGVERVLKRRTARVFNHFGAFTRKVARQSIRKRKGISTPGRPPHSHQGFLRSSILYGYNRTTESVVVGPIAKSKGGVGVEVRRGAPALLEYGGTLSRRPGRSRRWGKPRVYHYRARPYMSPAFEKAQERLPQFWAQSIG